MRRLFIDRLTAAQLDAIADVADTILAPCDELHAARAVATAARRADRRVI